MVLTRRHFLQGLAGTAITLLAGCGGASTAGSGLASNAPAPSVGASASIQAAKPGSVSTAASAASSAASSSEWETVVAAGKREGKLSMFGPVGDQVRSVLIDAFQKQFGITVDYSSVPGNTIGQKVILERNAGQYNWDVLIAGTTNSLVTLIPIKALDPIESALILPEVKDGKNWRGGAPLFFGPNHEILGMTPYQRGTLFYNKNLLKGDEIKSYKDLLDPKWKGKVQMDDPRRSGPGQATFIFFYLHPDLGLDFIRALGKQDITIQNDYQQEIDMVGQGRISLLIGGVDYLAEGRIKQGAPIGIVPSTQLKEGTDVSCASGTVAVFNKAPHPNAAKVYLNWLLGKEEATAFAKVNGFTSGRADVSADWAEPWRQPVPNGIQTDGEVALQVNPKLVPVLQEVFS